MTVKGWSTYRANIEFSTNTKRVYEEKVVKVFTKNTDNEI